LNSTETLHDCAHCGGTGTCKSVSGESCAVCVKKNELKRGQYFGLACGTCGGLGKTDTYTFRLKHRTQPLISIILVLFSLLLVLCFGLAGSQYFHEIMAFCTTLIGSVTGYYFSSRSALDSKS